MRTFVDLSAGHSSYGLVRDLLNENGFCVFSTSYQPIKGSYDDHPITALYYAILVDAPCIHGGSEIARIYESNLILVGHFGVEMYPVRCNFIPGYNVTRIDITRRCIVYPRGLAR